jgi:NitT/TauT family transport system permease protein
MTATPDDGGLMPTGPLADPENRLDAPVQGEQGRNRRASIWLTRSALLLGFLALWQFLPMIEGLRRVIPFMDPFFISSPLLVGTELFELFTGAGGRFIWGDLATTVVTALIGTIAGSVFGALMGLLLSNSDWWNRVLQPFILAVNAIPRIALVPIIIIIAGPGSVAAVVSAFIVVTFIVFYNAFEGGRSVPGHMLANAQLLGASGASLIWRVRFPMVLAWTFAALPNAVSFGLVSTITAEILAGSGGLGGELVIALALANATLTFAIVVLMSVVGVVLVMLTNLAKRRLLHWWEAEGN